MKNTIYKFYVTCLCVVLLIPSVGMMWWPTNESTENTPMVNTPDLFQNGELNIDILSDWGAWFNNHFAFRQYLITANSWLYTNFFRTSPVEKVILGQDDWLFYNETLADFTGEDLLTDREVYNIVHNLKLMQWSVQTQGASFMVTICPDKNSIYPEKMDKKYLQGEKKNLELFAEAMAENNIPYADISSELQLKKGKMIYYQRDSHWNQTGALYGYNQLMTSLGLEPKSYSPSGMSKHKGDLDEMLLPKAWHEEKEDDYSDNFQYSSNTDDYMKNFIHTVNEQGQGTLLMFRDSFGTNIIPYLADTWGQAYFSRLVPYNFVQLQELKPDTVIIERVERRIRSFEESAAIMIMPEVSELAGSPTGKSLHIQVNEHGDFLQFQGMVPLSSNQDDFYLQIRDQGGKVKKTVPVFYTVDEERNNCFDVYLLKSLIDDSDKIEVVKVNEKRAVTYIGDCVQGEEK